MNYSRKKITLLVGALIIGQALTMQNAQAMETDNNNIDENTQTTTNVDNTENIFSVITDSNLSHQGKKLYDNLFDKAAQIKQMVDDTPTNFSNICSKLKDSSKNAYNATMQNRYTKLGIGIYNFISNKYTLFGISICDAITNKIKSLYNYDYTTLYNNASTQGRVLYNQASDKTVILKNEASKWYRDDMPILRNNLSQAANKDFWIKGWNNTINCTNNAVECIKNIPQAIEVAIDNKIKNKAADAFNLDPNAPINAEVIIDKAVKTTVFSLAMYTTAVTAGLVATYKTYMYAANKYQEYQKNAALNESIKQHLTDEKKAEIAQSTGKELSDNDIQEIINNIKTHATAAQDNHVTQTIVDLAVKEYINKQTNA